MILHDIQTPFVAPPDLILALSHLANGGGRTRRFQPYLTPTGRLHVRITETNNYHWTANTAVLRDYAGYWRTWGMHERDWAPIAADDPRIDWSRVR